jgi:GWxTD domain-containing protein
VDHFKREFPLPPPPFSIVERGAFKYKPDSSFVISKKNGSVKLAIPERGFYHMITEKETKEGVSLFSVGSAFPGLKDEADMIRSVRYITSLNEYNKLMDAENKKQAIDEFWKEIGGSNERAKALLKKYYARVYEANRLFTSFLPGWQSDRGMIYVVFGPPSTMYKYPNTEVWIYGDENLPTSVKFNFIKYVNPFTDNDFVLERNEFYRLPWDQATRGWKEGHIYYDN